MELIKQLVDDGNWVGVLDRDGVQLAVVDAEPPRSVCLFDEEDRGREGGVAAPYDALLEHRVTLLLQFVFVSSGVAVRADRHRGRVRLEDDAVGAAPLKGPNMARGG